MIKLLTLIRHVFYVIIIIAIRGLSEIFLVSASSAYTID